MTTKTKTTQEQRNAQESFTDQVNKDAEELREIVHGKNESDNGDATLKQEAEPKEEHFETVSQSLSFHDFKEQPVLIGTFCGTGKQVDKTKTWLIFDRENSVFVIVPQWKMLEKLETVDGEKLGRQVVRISYKGTRYDKANPKEVVFQDVELAMSNVDATGDFAFSPAQITKILTEANKPKA